METFCLSLLKAWQKMGIEPVLYTSYAGGVRESQIPQSVETVCWNVQAKRSFLRIAKWLRRRPDDPCLALSQEMAVVLLFLKKFRLIKNRIYFRESTDTGKHYGKIFKHCMQWLWPTLDGIIEQSEYCANVTRRICRGKMPPCMIVRNMMPIDDRCVNEESFARRSSVRLACVGSFKRMKGQELLVRSLSEDRDRDWHLTLWGEGERRFATEQLVEAMGLADRITFNDWERDKDKIYRDVECLVIPSDYEGLPNVMLEAILRGKRVSVRPTCVGACELLEEIGIGETWPWRKAMEIPSEQWMSARDRLAKLCYPETVARGIANFMEIDIPKDDIRRSHD